MENLKILFMLSLINITVLFPVTIFNGYSNTPMFTYVTISKYDIFISPYNLTNISFLLENATQSIYAELYELTYQPIINILAEKASEGVQVYIVLSNYTYGGIPYDEESAVSYLENHNVHVKFVSAFMYVHSKVFVIDNNTVIISTNNPTYYGLTQDKGLAIAIFNKTISEWFSTIILNDYRCFFNNYTYPGLIISPVNSYSQLYGLFSYPSSYIYASFEEIYEDSDLTSVLLSHQHSMIVTTRNDVGLPTTNDLTAKIVVNGNYVYIGSINLSHTSLFDNRELGIIIKNTVLASEMIKIIENWSGDTNNTSTSHYTNQSIISTSQYKQTVSHNDNTGITPSVNIQPNDVISSIIQSLKQIVTSINVNAVIVAIVVLLLIFLFYTAVEKKK